MVEDKIKKKQTQSSYLVLHSNLFLIMQCQLLWPDYYAEDKVNPTSSLVLFGQVKREVA